MSQPDSRGSKAGNLLFDTFYAAGIGGAVVAIFFLISDIVTHEAFWTPSLMGTVIFTDATAAEVTAIRLDMVAFFTVLHFAFFGALGLIMSLLVNSTPHLADRPAAVTVIAFIFLQGGFMGLDLTIAPGIIEAMGMMKVLAANALTGAGMAYFLLRSHRQSAHDETLIPSDA